MLFLKVGHIVNQIVDDNPTIVLLVVLSHFGPCVHGLFWVRLVLGVLRLDQVFEFVLASFAHIPLIQ
jgi:hypothetical protein